MTTTITSPDAIRQAYRDPTRVEHYIEERFVGDPFGRELHRRQVNLLRQTLAPSCCSQLLEIACGPARLTVHLPPIKSVCALEQSPQMLEQARKRLQDAGRAHWELIEGDAFHLPWNAPAFDATMTFRFLRHFDRPDRSRLLSEIRRVLRPGGLLVLDVASQQSYEWLLPKQGIHQKWIGDFWYSAASFRHEMADEGFPVQSLYPVHAPVRLQYRLFAHIEPRLPRLAAWCSRAATAVIRKSPLEWVAVCRRA